MADGFDEAVERLRWLGLRGRHLDEQAAAKLAELNRMVRALGAAGPAGAPALLGGVVGRRPYPPGSGPAGSEQLAVAGLLPEDGLGVFLVDRAAYEAAGRGEGGAPAALFVPLELCPPPLAWAVVPDEARDLVRRLAERPA